MTTQGIPTSYSHFPSRMYDVHLKDHVVVHEVSQSRLVGNNATYFSRSEKDVFRLLLGKELLHGFLTGQVKFLWVLVIILV